MRLDQSKSLSLNNRDEIFATPTPGILPQIPESPLTWNRIPLFHVGCFPSNFSGKLFFVLGQGLGDHVNGFRVLQEVKDRFPRASYCVYADRRWEELVLRIPDIEIRWYPTAMDPRSKSGTNDPYGNARKDILQETRTWPGAAFLAYDHFPMPDRHARGETTLEAISRTIGLALKEKARPFLPTTDHDRDFAGRFLKDHSLQDGQYIVMAPYSWPNKMWPKDNFAALIDILRERHGLRSVIVSYPEIGEFPNEEVIMATGLTLGQVSGLLARAGLYVGLDSGPSHMAAAFDLPMVGIFVEKKTIPFEVRALSPWALYGVEGFDSSKEIASLETVADAASFLWNRRANADRQIPRCPACERAAHFLSGTGPRGLSFLCVCGLEIDEREVRPSEQTTMRRSKSPNGSETLFFDATVDLSLRAFVESAEKEIRSLRPSNILGLVQETEGSEIPRDGPAVRWTQDALIFWMSRLGYFLDSINSPSISESGGTTMQFLRADLFEKRGNPQKIRMSWREGRGTLSSSTQYVSLLTFSRWGGYEDLVGIVKACCSLGFYNDALRVAWVAFQAKKSFRTFRWLVKASLFRLKILPGVSGG